MVSKNEELAFKDLEELHADRYLKEDSLFFALGTSIFLYPWATTSTFPELTRIKQKMYPTAPG